MSWFAHLVQYPSEKPDSSLLLTCCNSWDDVLIMDTVFDPIFDRGYRRLYKRYQVEGRLAQYHDKSLVVVELPFWGWASAEPRNWLDTLYSKVSPETRLVFLSHGGAYHSAPLWYGDVFPLTLSIEHTVDPAYFAALFDELDNGGREAFLRDLMLYGREAKAA